MSTGDIVRKHLSNADVSAKKSATDPTANTNHNPTKPNSNAKWFIC